jgi:hypothetical protein
VLSQFPFLPSPFFGLGSWLKIRTIEWIRYLLL